MASDFKIVAFDETRFWSSGFMHHYRTGRMWGLYLFDASRQVNCCELVPSYEMHFIKTVTERILDEFAYDELLRADIAYLDEVVYRHCSAVDALDSDWICQAGGHLGPFDDYEAELQDALEHARCNENLPPALMRSLRHPATH